MILSRSAVNLLGSQAARSCLDNTFDSSRLTAEPHNFSRVFTGCIYDTISRLFARGQQDVDGLATAARTVGSLLVAAVKDAQLTPTMFAEVGQQMINHDGGANIADIRAAFDRHGITLAPPAPMTKIKINEVNLEFQDTDAMVSEYLEIDRSHVTLTHHKSPVLGVFAHATAFRPIDVLDGLSINVPVTTRLTKETLIGDPLKKVTWGLGQPLRPSEDMIAQAKAYARMLAATGAIQDAPQSRLPAVPSRLFAPSHAIRETGGRRMIVRQRFQ